MDYLEIILKGYFDKTERQYFSDYLIEQFNESKVTNPNKFFDGLLNVAEEFIKTIDEQVFERKRNLNNGIVAAKTGNLVINDRWQDLPYEEHCKKAIEDFKEQWKETNRYTYSVNLYAHFGKFEYPTDLWYNDILFIKRKIEEARAKVLVEKIKEQPQQARENSQSNEDKKSPQTLSDIFESTAKYKKVMEILVSQKLVKPNSYIWRDEGKGNKQYLAALIKDLHEKGYYKDNIRPTTKQIKAICQNSFGWTLGEDTIKKARPEGFGFSFIPYSSMI